MCHAPAAIPPTAQRPFLSVLTTVPPPRSGSSSLTVTPTSGAPDSSVTFPSIRPIPFQSCAIAGTVSASAHTATTGIRRRATNFMDDLSLEPV